MRVSLGSDHSCQSHVQTRAYDVGPFPLVGLADIRISVSWGGGGHVNPTLLVKLQGKSGLYGAFTSSWITDKRSLYTRAKRLRSRWCEACVCHDFNGNAALQAFSQRHAVEEPMQSSPT